MARIICSILCLFICGCVHVNYDSWEFSSVSKCYRVGSGEVSLTMTSTSYNTFNSKNRAPWYLIVKASSEKSDDRFFISNVRVNSNEESVLLLSKRELVEKNRNYTGGGTLWSKFIEKGFSPKYYDGQILKISIEVELSDAKKTIEEHFVPKRIKGKEWINILTM